MVPVLVALVIVFRQETKALARKYIWCNFFILLIGVFIIFMTCVAHQRHYAVSRLEVYNVNSGSYCTSRVLPRILYNGLFF